VTDFNPDGGSDEDFSFDASQARESKYVIPDAWYGGVVSNVERATSSSGNPMYVWYIDGTEGPSVGITFRVYTVLSDDAIWRLLNMVQSLGMPIPADKKVSFKKKDVIGKQLKFLTKVEEYNGKKRSGITEVKPHPAGAERVPF
jgi:hypothetical protein